MAEVVAANEAMVCWTIGSTTVVQTRNHAARLRRRWLAWFRRIGWTLFAAFVGRNLRRVPVRFVRDLLEGAWLAGQRLVFKTLSGIGGFSLYGPDKIMDYWETPSYARYAFTFWAVPSENWVDNLRAYVEFADEHFRRTGFRCNMPLGSYFVKQDRGSLLSYTWDGDVLSLDPIHSYRAEDADEWYAFLRAFNAWAHERGGIALLNQSPFVTREQVLAAYGDRWRRFSEWAKEVDPGRRMVNEFFADLLV